MLMRIIATLLLFSGFSASYRTTAGAQAVVSTPAIPLTQQEGMLPVPGGRVWYRLTGSGSGTPILAIHGGPDGTSCRLRELARLSADRAVIFYDQLGTGRSDRPADTTLWTLPRFVAEVDAILTHLRLADVILFGHSWGGTIATEYVLTHPAAGVRALILAGPLLSTPRWLADADALVATLPAPARRAIAAADRNGRYDGRDLLVVVYDF